MLEQNHKMVKKIKEKKERYSEEGCNMNASENKIRMYRLIFKKGSDDLYELLENDNLREYEIEGLLNLCKSLEESLESIKQGLNAKLQSLKQTRDLKSEL
jgi:hypothetical protein